MRGTPGNSSAMRDSSFMSGPRTCTWICFWLSSPPPESDAAGRTEKVRRKRKFPFRKAADIETEIGETEAKVHQLEESLTTPDV